MERLLIVDDEAGPRASLRQLFKHDFMIDEATTPEGALALVRRNSPIAAIVDLRLRTNFEGLDLIKTIHTEAPLTALFAVSGYAETREVILAMRHGVEDFFEKPWDVKHMHATVLSAVADRVQERDRPWWWRKVQLDLWDLLVGLGVAALIARLIAWVFHRDEGP